MTSDLLFDFSVNKETKTVHILRELNAPLELVWDAWTKPELLDQWWGPDPCVSKTKYMNFVPGGQRLFAMIMPGRPERWLVQKYISISPKTHFRMLSIFADKDENLELPGSEWDLTFSEENGITKVSIIITNESLERMERLIEGGFLEGFSKGLQQLDELLQQSMNK